VPVEIGQAGGRVACSCGAQLDVPPLRKLRHLPAAEEAKQRSPITWNGRRGVVAAGLILALTFCAASLISRVTEPTIPPFDPVGHERSVLEREKSWTPVEAWQWWIGHYRPQAQRGFTEFVYRDTPIVQQQIVERRFFQKTMLVVAAVCSAVALAAAVWPQSNARTRAR
jgi:hypothetical protein